MIKSTLELKQAIALENPHLSKLTIIINGKFFLIWCSEKLFYSNT